MANGIFAKAKEVALQAGMGLTGNVKAILIDSADYTVNLATHQFADTTTVPAVARVSTSPNLGTKTYTGGVFDSADFTFTAVTGDPCEALLLYVDTGTPATSPLIAFYDTGVTGLPVTPNGGDINVTVHASGWFAL